MVRLRRLVRGDRAFFVTTNLRRGLRRFTSSERDLICRCIAVTRARRKSLLAGYVVMPDHLHLLVLPASGDTVSSFLKDLKFSTARRINKIRRTNGPLWQKGFFDRFMRTPKELLEKLDYIHQNPVRKGFVSNAVGWRWSSASAYSGDGGIIAVYIVELPAQTEKSFY